MEEQIFTQVFTLMAMMVVGIFAYRLKIVGDTGVKDLSAVLINVAIPATILTSFDTGFSHDLLANMAAVFAISSVMHLGLIVLSRLFYAKIAPEKRKVFCFSTVFSNCGFVGFPLAQGLYGDVGVFYVSIFTIPFNILMFSYGVRLFSGSGNLRDACKSLVNAPMIAMGGGLVLFFSPLRLPEIVAQPLTFLGNMTTPLSMLVIGAILAGMPRADATGIVKDPSLYYLSFVKLILVPVAVFAALHALRLDPTVIGVCVVLAAMPTASLVGIFAQRYNGDLSAAAQCTALTTALSVLTIPAVFSIL